MPEDALPDLTQLAILARLKIDPDEAERLESQLSNILKHFRTLDSLDTAGIDASPYAVTLENVLRDDGPLRDAEQQLPSGTDLVAEHAPRTSHGGYRVPPMID